MVALDGQGGTWEEFIAGWELFRDPVYCATIAGFVLGFLSVYIVLKRMVFVSAAVTQGAGLGVALAFYSSIHLGIGIEPAYGAVAVSLAVSFMLVLDPQSFGLSRETMLGAAFALTGGAAVLVGSRITQEAHDIQAILFGTAVLVSPEDFYRVAAAGGVIMVFHLWWFRGLTFASFDPVAARVQGLPVGVLDSALLISIGVMVGVSARALGALPSFALSTLPGMAALLIVRAHLWTVFVIAATLGTLAGAGGYVFAFLEDLPVGSSQTVAAVAILVAALAVRQLILRLKKQPSTSAPAD
ncbi:MAG: metal ABC transporter permease [Proteobacteria bacterium]|nr:metal ABC transporter permease [Pseudomonadota bacterium]